MNYILMLVSPIFLHRELVVAIATNGAAAAFGGSSRPDTGEGTSLVNTATFLLPIDYPRVL